MSDFLSSVLTFTLHTSLTSCPLPLCIADCHSQICVAACLFPRVLYITACLFACPRPICTYTMAACLSVCLCVTVCVCVQYQKSPGETPAVGGGPGPRVEVYPPPPPRGSPAPVHREKTVLVTSPPRLISYLIGQNKSAEFNFSYSTEVIEGGCDGG
jgi:hypothetical protein